MDIPRLADRRGRFPGLVAAVGPDPRGCRWAALAAFIAFFGASTSKALAGEATCGCFGRVAISPRWTASLDFAAILALWLWQPAEGSGRPWGSHRVQVAAILPLSLLLSIFGGIMLAVSRPTALNNPISPDGAGDKALLVSSPDKLDFGAVPAGGRAEARFSLRNPGTSVVKVREITTSCGCFRVVLGNTVIGPEETAEAIVWLNLADEPDFVGTLRLTAVAKSGEQFPAFVVRAKVTVEKRLDE